MLLANRLSEASNCPMPTKIFSMICPHHHHPPPKVNFETKKIEKSSKMTDRYHLLSQSLPGNHVGNMLGRVVVDKRDPLHRFVPYTDDGAEPLHPSDIVPDLSDEPVQYDDLSKVLDAAQNNEARLRLHNILDAHARQRTAQNVKMTSAVVVRYNMINVERQLKRLMGDRQYRTQVLQLLSEKNGKPLPMVTGLLTCKNTVVTLDKKAERGAGAGFRVPVGEAMGGPSLGDPEAKVEHLRNKGNTVESKIKKEVIFALAYDEVKLAEYVKRKRWYPSHRSQSKNPKVVLGDKIPGEGFDIYFGANDDLEEDTDDDDEKGLTGKGCSDSLQLAIC